MLLCSFLLLSIGFSTVANAEELPVDKYWIELYTRETYGTTVIRENIYLDNGYDDFTYEEIPNPVTVNGKHSLEGRWTVYARNGDYLIEGGKTTRVTLSNFYFSILYYLGDRFEYYRNPTCSILINYTDGLKEYVECTASMDYSDLNVYFEFKPRTNVESFELIYQQEYTIPSGYTNIQKCEIMIGEGVYADYGHRLSVDIQSEESGLLSGIKGIIQNLLNTVKELPGKLGEIGTYILELPNKIIEGIKSLFVPSDYAVSVYVDEMKALIADRLGAVYEVIEISLESWDKIQDKQSEAVTMPEVTIPLPDDNEFTFGGWTVPVVPVGFEFLAVASKTIIGIIATVAFVNGLRKRYDEVMGVEQ